jgi:hypothetical protein
VLKALIVMVLIAMLISLFSGLVFLFRDAGNPAGRRTLHALGVRIALAITLVALVGYGLYTGELAVRAPWHQAG